MVLLACLAMVAVLASPAGGQDNETGAPPPPPPEAALAAMRITGEVPQARVRDAVEQLRDAMLGMGRFESLREADSVAAVVRLAMTTASIGPGATVVVTRVESNPQSPARAQGIQIAATISVDGDASVDRLVGAWPDPDHGGIVFIRQTDSEIELCFKKGDFKECFLEPGALDPFASHAPESADGVQLMLDLENLRRAWPQSLADGPARRVVAVTGLANARKIHLHVPESGAVRLAYSSRALVPGDISTRTGPPPAGETAIGVRWPAIADAALRAYALALEEDARAEFGASFQQWMGAHGNRLRGILQAVEIGMDWSVEPTGDGLGATIAIPVRNGIDMPRLAEALKATLASSGFTVDDDAGTLALPGSVAAALGGSTLTIELEQQNDAKEGGEQAGPARLFVRVE